MTISAILLKNRNCRNPNGRWGQCIPIYACPSLHNVLRNRMQSSYRFLRLSQCKIEESIIPLIHVCCTPEIQFKAKNDNIIFPDMITYAVTKLPASSKLTTTFANNDHHNNRLIYPSVLYSSTENYHSSSTVLIPSKVTNKVQKFPKPPDCGAITISNKIYGGDEAELTEFSWMVNLEYERGLRKFILLIKSQFFSCNLLI